MKTKLLFFFFIFLGIVAMTTSCSKDNDSKISVQSISLDKTELPLTIGATGALKATISPADASNKAFGWLSSDAAVATVNNGTVTATDAGTAIITAKTEDGAHAATCIVTVTKHFPDDNFRKVLVEDYGFVQERGDILPDNATNKSKFSTITEIACGSKEIVSLQGLEYFTVLAELYCADNKIADLDISKNTTLIDLACFDNQLTQLDVSKNTALKSLRCDDNQLTTLDMSKNLGLNSLICINNPLTSLDVSKNTMLTTLACYNNQLTSLDVSKNTALTALWCDGNKMTTLNISMLPTFVDEVNIISCGNQQGGVILTLVLTQAQNNGAWSINKDFDANTNVVPNIVQP